MSCPARVLLRHLAFPGLGWPPVQLCHHLLWDLEKVLPPFRPFGSAVHLWARLCKEEAESHVGFLLGHPHTPPNPEIRRELQRH